MATFLGGHFGHQLGRSNGTGCTWLSQQQVNLAAKIDHKCPKWDMNAWSLEHARAPRNMIIWSSGSVRVCESQALFYFRHSLPQ
jgi:hypothetical protein